MKKSAIISQCGSYRYILWREWGSKADSKRYVAFVGLNPSTADENNDDPTLRRCINFTKSWGYDSMCLVNLFAFRTKDPKLISIANDPIGIDCDSHLKSALDGANLVVAAWGNGGSYLDRGEYVKEIVNKYDSYCLGLTKLGHPKHPLYIKKSQELIKF